MGLYLRSFGLSVTEFDLISGLYSARRVLPSIADCSQKPPEFRLDIGGWQDKHTGTRTAMPNLYSAARVQTQVARKRELLITANLAMNNYINMEGATIHPSWEELFDHWPSPKDFDVAMVIAESASGSNPIVKKAAALAQTPIDAESDDDFWDGLTNEITQARDNDDVYTEASEESEIDMDKQAEDEVYPAETAAINWQLATGKHGRLHLECSHGLACGRELRRPVSGKGLV